MSVFKSDRNMKKPTTTRFELNKKLKQVSWESVPCDLAKQARIMLKGFFAETQNSLSDKKRCIN